MIKETELLLIRHGAIDNPNDVAYGRLEGFPLSEIGKRQVSQLVEILKAKGIKFDIIYSSPLERTVQTAQILKDKLEVESLVVREKLTDIDIGNLSGQPMDVIRQAQFNSERLRVLGYTIETPNSVLARISDLFQETIQKYQGKCVAFVTHGDIARIFLWSLQNPETPTLSDLRDKDYLPPAGAVILQLDSDGKLLGYEHISKDSSDQNQNPRKLEAS